MLICMTDLMQILSQIEQGDAGQPPKHLICDRDSIYDCSAFRRYLDLPIAARGSNRVPIGRDRHPAPNRMRLSQASPVIGSSQTS